MQDSFEQLRENMRVISALMRCQNHDVRSAICLADLCDKNEELLATLRRQLSNCLAAGMAEEHAEMMVKALNKAQDQVIRARARIVQGIRC